MEMIKPESTSSLGSDGNTSFLRAARAGHLDKVLEHLKSNIDINTCNANGLNALHLASKDGHVEVVEELLRRSAAVDAATKKGNTALHIASLAGQEEVVKLLVQHGASVNVQSQNGFTPLYMAAQENHDNVVKYLLANGANQSLATEDGFTPLAVAMQQGHDKVVTVLLENDTRGKVRLPALHIAAKKDDVKAAKLLLENEHNPDVTSKSGFTPLHIASHYGNELIANLLVQKGADVNYAAKHNISPLHVAAKWGKTNMVALLLDKGANIESKTRDGLTPLHCAARSGHEQVVDMLLERGAPISSKTKNGLAPLHMSAQGDHVDAARILLYHRAPVDEVTVDYLTALHVAAHCGHARVAKLLLDRQADANARALNGFTPLHIACKKNRIKVVELLLKHGASIGATTESGLTPLHVASFMGCMNIVIYLLQHDANPDVPTVRGETPLHLAARANQTDIIRILLRNGAHVDARAREQQTPLHIASRLGNVDIVVLLLQHGAKVDTTTKDMYTALHIAAKEGQDEVAGVLIDHGASLSATTKKGFTPLHLAAKYGNIKVAKLLLQKEAPVDAQGKNGVTPLHVASHYDHQNVALLLLERGASPHATAKNGHTPLHIAAKKNQMDIANTLLEYGAQPNAESKAGFTPLHLSSQEGHADMSALLIEHDADVNHQAKNGLMPLHLCAQEDRVPVAEILVKNGAEVDAGTKGGYTPLHVASHFGQTNMVKFLLSNGANVRTTTSIGYTPLHQAAQQGHTNIVNILLENSAQPNAVTMNGQTPLHIAQKLGYISVIETLKTVTEHTTSPTNMNAEDKYKVVAPEAMQETFMSDSEEEGGEETMLGDQTYRYLTADEMKSLGDDSLPIDVTKDERIDSNKMVTSSDSNILPPQAIEDSLSPLHITQNYIEYKKYIPDNVDIGRHPISIGFLVSFLVDARGGAMRGCRHSGVRVIVPPRCASSPTRITCRYVRPQRTPHPPPLMEGEALASRVLELGPVSAKFLGPVIIEVPHFAALRGKEREIVILRSDNGETWREHTVEASEEILNDVLHDSFEAEDLNQLEDVSSGRITRIVTHDFPQYFAVVSRVRQEVHAIGPEGGMVSSTVVPQVQAVFPQGALTKKIKVGLQAQPIDPELTAKLLGHGVAVSPVVTVEPRRRKFHKAITLSMPAPRAHSQGMINQYSGSAPTLRLLCSITGGTTRAQWEDVTGSTPLTFVNDCVSFTTTVSARFWLMDCRNIGDATKMATELYREAIHVPFMAKFVVFAKRIDPLEARLRVFCMTDDKEDKTLEHQEHFTEVAKSRDVEVLEGKPQYIEFAGNLVPITKSGDQLQFSFRAFRENRLPFSVRVKDQHAEAVGRSLFMREPKVQKGEPPQQPICILNIVLPDDIVAETISLSDESLKRSFLHDDFDYYRPDPRLADMSNLLGEDWVPLATQLGLTTSEINVIISEYPDSVAKQAQSMLRMWRAQAGNKAQGNTLENALRRIGREDIIPQCLNVEDTPRIHKENLNKYRLRKDISLDTTLYDRDIMKDSESVESLVQAERKEDKYKKRESYESKYSAEEKVVEETSDEEEDFNKTVTERRNEIEKRLSVERSIPASLQRVEIVQEIDTIKRQSLVEDKIAEVEDKHRKPETKVISETVEVKTTKTSEPREVISVQVKPEIKTTTTEVRTVEITHKNISADRRDSDLLEGVTRGLETSKGVMPRISTSVEDPNSPKLSRTPPPSPADFIIKEQAALVQEWDATGKKKVPVSHVKGTPTIKAAADKETASGLTQPELTPLDPTPKPKPRSTKSPDIQQQLTSPIDKTPIIHEEHLSSVQDVFSNIKIVPIETEIDSYSDRKKFWETISNDPIESLSKKRLSLFEETTIPDKQMMAKKRVSLYEVTPPVPKPRAGLQTAQSLGETEDSIQKTLSLDSTTSDSSGGAPPTELTKISESDISCDEEISTKIVSEYQASFRDPFSISERKPYPLPTETTIEKSDSFDSDQGQQGGDNTGYISDSGDVEHYISDSEIEDRVPQIRERQMSVFQPPIATTRKTIYERSVSLPTEDLYEVSAKSIKLRKQYFEEQFKKDMVEDQESEEEPSPEYKTLGVLHEEVIQIPETSDVGEELHDSSPLTVKELAKTFGGSVATKVDKITESTKIVAKPPEERPASVEHLAKSFKHVKDVKTLKDIQLKEITLNITDAHKPDIADKIEKTHKPDIPTLDKKLSKEILKQESKTGKVTHIPVRIASQVGKGVAKMETMRKAETEKVTHIPDKIEKIVEKGVSKTVITQKEDSVGLTHTPDVVTHKFTIESKDVKIEEKKDLQSHKPDNTTHKRHEDEVTVQFKEIETHKETEPDPQTKRSSTESEKSMSSDRSLEFGMTDDTQTAEVFQYRDDSASKPSDSMEVHVDRSEMEDLEKADFEQDTTDIETKSLDSLNATEISPKTSFNADEPIPEITITLSGKQRRISEDSLDSFEEQPIAPFVVASPIAEKPEVTSPVHHPEEHIQDTVWEASQQYTIFDEKAVDLPINKHEIAEKDEEFSGSAVESDLGSEIHQDHSDSYSSDRVKSDRSDIEKIILESLYHQKISPEEAQKIASELIEDIETEIQRRPLTADEISAPPHPEMAKNQISEYLRQLAESKGLDSREVELVESVLARKQREIIKLARDDTQASSMEITDEDLKYSGGDIDYSPPGSQAHILEQLEAEKAEKSAFDSIEKEYAQEQLDAKALATDKIDEKRTEEKVINRDHETFEDGKKSTYKSDTHLKTIESTKGEKSTSETRDTIMEEDESVLETLAEESEHSESKKETVVTQLEKSKTEGAATIRGSSALIIDETNSLIDTKIKATETKTDTAQQEQIEIVQEERDKSKLFSTFTAETKTQEKTYDTLKDTVSKEKTEVEKAISVETDLQFDELKSHTIAEDGTEIKTSQTIEKIHKSVASSSVVTDESHKEVKTVTSTILSDLAEGDLDYFTREPEKFKEIKTKTDRKEQLHEEVKRSLSDESKSSQDESGKTPEDQFSSCSSGRKGDSDTAAKISEKHDVLFRKTRSRKDADTSSSSGNLKPDRKSGIDFEAYSSSGESHYHSFELDSTKSRPCSSDVEGLIAAGSSEYESALTSQEISARSHMVSEYHTAVSSLSSKESMKSLDSESSGNLASVEQSEASETLVPSAFEIDGDILDSMDQSADEVEPYDHQPIRQSTEVSDSEIFTGPEESIDEEDSTNDSKTADNVQTKMKRSHEMTFQPEPKIFIPESPQSDIQDAEEKLGTSLDEGSILSMSLSSTSSAAALRTVISRADSERISCASEQISLDEVDILRGSRESLTSQVFPHDFPTPTPLSTADTSTSTQHIPEFPIGSVTIQTSVVAENGIQNVSTQVTSQTQSPEQEFIAFQEEIDMSLVNGPTEVDYIPEYDDVVEPKKKGHRRYESTTSFVPSLSFGRTEVRQKFQSDLAESDKYTAELSSKEISSYEKKDIDETEKEESYETEADQGFHRDLREGRFLDSESDQDTLPTASGIDAEKHEKKVDKSGTDFQTVEQTTSTRAHDIHLTDIRKLEAAEKLSREIHGRVSTSSSEKSSFEEAEAEAAFSMVAHFSPAHKVKQICPILEDVDAEKHELETRERIKKDFEERRALLKDLSPSAIPDIKVTQHMEYLVDPGFHYPDLELEEQEEEAQKSTPQTPASNSSKSSEETDQGREYVLGDVDDMIPEEPEGTILDEKEDKALTESRSDVGTVVERTLQEAASPTESPNSDSFEMLEKPDLIDDFVVIEEVGKEAYELDTEGKSLKIASTKYVKKHDEEVEAYLVKSAPAATSMKYHPNGSSSDELAFEFEDSPPQAEQKDTGVSAKSGRDYVYEYDRELEANRKWIEQQFQGDHAAMMAAGYGYEMEFERAPLEDIKEEEAADFDPTSSRIGSVGSQKESGGSLGSVKDSFSSTPEYDVLAGRKYFTRSGEHDDASVSSLQEFENLERALENRKFYPSSQESSNGSMGRRFYANRSGQGDDVSVSSLKEFEGLEKACIQAHKIEVKVKEEEAMLTQIDEGQESIASETESCETISGTDKKIIPDSDDEDYEKRMFEIDEIIKQAQSNVEKFIDMKEEKTESLGRGDSLEEVSKVPDLDLDAPAQKPSTKVQWADSEDVMITSADSLDMKPDKTSRHDSTDSLEQKTTAGDIMTASTDSIEFQAHKSAKETIMTDSIEVKDDRSCLMTSSDSLELATGVASNIQLSDSMDEEGSRIGMQDQSSSSTSKDFSSSVKEEPEQFEIRDRRSPFVLGNADGLDISSSTATHATYQYETDSVFSGSFTSGGSNTMVSSTDTIDPNLRETVDVAAAVRKVWFDVDAEAGQRYSTEYIEDDSKPYVTEVIEPCEDDIFSHTIHRKVELPPEIKKITFKGPDADQQMRQFVENFGEGEDVQESEEVDADGNVHVKRVVQKRFIIKTDGTGEEKRISGPEIEQYFQQFGQTPVDFEGQGVVRRTYMDSQGTKTIYTQQFGLTQGQDPTSAVHSLLTSIAGDTTAGEASGEWQHTPISGPEGASLRAETDEAPVEEPESTIPGNIQQRQIADQHRLSEEMKLLLKEMEEQHKK